MPLCVRYTMTTETHRARQEPPSISGVTKTPTHGERPSSGPMPPPTRATARCVWRPAAPPSTARGRTHVTNLPASLSLPPCLSLSLIPSTRGCRRLPAALPSFMLIAAVLRARNCRAEPGHRCCCCCCRCSLTSPPGMEMSSAATLTS